jgi:hypothetical protein
MAVIECAPSERAEVLKTACPLFSGALPRSFVPSSKVTVPVGVPEPEEVTVAVGVPEPEELTVAVNVTVWPTFAGFGEPETEVDVVPPVLPLTVCESTAEVLPLKFESPPYTTVIECGPTDNDEVARLARPLVSEPFPSVFAPSLKVTVPVGVPELFGVTVAVKVTG